MDLGGDRLVQEAEDLELLERLVNLADQAAARHGTHHMIGNAPAEVLGDLEPDRLRSFGVKKAQVHVDKAPAEAKRNLGTKAIDLIVVAVDRDHVGAVNGRPEYLSLFEPRRNEHVGLQPGRGGVGGHAVGQVARRSASHCLKAKFDGLGKRHRDDAILERQGRMIHRVVLDVELRDPKRPGEPIRTHKRRAADMLSNARVAV